MTNRLALFCLGWLTWAAVAVPSFARAEVARFALIVGNNRGSGADTPLAYAESDAVKVHAVLRDLGGFSPLNMALLESQDATTVRGTLIELNERVRASRERGDESVLFVYYSGHADVRELHLGETGLAIKELAGLVRGSAATFRLLVLDACRSGALTRLKGGTAKPPFELPRASRLAAEGLAFLTASSESEDAQESDEIRGSYFTHALVSGLLGAADRNGDGLVVLEEAYRHAYDATVRDTSRSAYGVQHPTFQYDLRGQDGLVLTSLHGAAKDRASLRLPAGVAFVLMRDNEDGAVLAEVPAQGAGRTLSLRPGAYFLRGRGEGFLLEGRVSLKASEAHTLRETSLVRVEYARLVRKGGDPRAHVHALEAGASLHSITQGADTLCLGATVGHVVELSHLSLMTRLGMCRSELENTTLRATSREYEMSFAVLHPWDVSRVTVAVGLGAGVMLAQQTFSTEGRAPSRLSSQPSLQLVGVLTTPITSRTFLRLDLRAGTDFVKLRSEGRDAALHTEFVLRGALLVGLFLL